MPVYNSAVFQVQEHLHLRMDLEKFRAKAANQEKLNGKLFNTLKRKKPKDLDTVVHRLHDEAFSHIDCLTCANCCKTTSPIFYQRDLDRAAKHLGMKTGDFIQNFIHMDEDGDFVLNHAPCPFLGEDNFCSIYESRPDACREYPHTNRKKVVQIMDLTMKNTMVCPAVLEIAAKLRKIFP